MKQASLHITLLIGLGIACQAQPLRRGADSTAADSLRTYRAEVVTVEARSVLPLISRSAQPHAVVTRREIQGGNAIDLADVVGYAPGVFVKQYGGVGGLRTISLRGTSAQQTVILIDGIRYRGSADGAFDLGNIPASMLERIEVVRGGNGALYGANALGGAINIVTRASGGPPLGLAARSGVGSFGERTLGAEAQGTTGKHQWGGGLHATSTAGDYPFAFNEFGALSTVRRENADFTNFFGRGFWGYQGDGGARLTVAAQGYGSERGVPGAVVQGNREQPHARLDERDITGTALFILPLDGWSLALSGSGRFNRLGYRDPDALLEGPDGARHNFDEWEWNTTARGRGIGIFGGGLLDAVVEVAHVALDGDNLDPSVGSSVRRTQGSAAVSGSWFFDEGLFGCETAIEGGLRGDLFSDIAPALSPSVGVVWRAWDTPLRLRARAGTSYRAPSFSEQYYLNYGNADLRPERSVSWDAGLTYEVSESLALESSFFLIATRDQIVSVPRSPVSWSAANIARTLSRGVELSVSGSLFEEMLGLRSSYTLMRAEDRSGGETDGRALVYAPQEIFNGIVDLRLGRYGVGISWQYVGHRFTLPLNDPSSSLPHYALAGGNISGGWDIGMVGVRLRLECSNIFGEEYQVVRNYPMPGRTFRANVELRYTTQEGQ